MKPVGPLPRAAWLLAPLVQLAISRPKTVVLAALLLTALSWLGVRQLELRGDIYELFPEAPGPISALGRYARTFTTQQEVVVLISGGDRQQVEQATLALSDRLGRSPLIAQVRTQVPGRALAGALSPSLLLLAGEEAWPAVRRRLGEGLDAQVARLRRILLSPVSPERELLTRDPLLLSELVLQGLEGGVDRQSGLFTSPEGKAALIFAQPRGALGDVAFVARLRAELQRQAAAVERPGVAVQFTGAPLYTHYMAQALRHDLTLSSLWALVGVVLVQLLFFRSLRLIPLSLLVVGSAILWTLAVAALTVGRLNALSLSFAALCIGIGLDALIHVTAKARELGPLAPGPRIQQALLSLAPALLATSLTTIAAFLTFGLSDFAGLSQTGLWAGLALAFTLLLAVLLFPALATLLPPAAGVARPSRVGAALGALGRLVTRWPWAVLGLFGCLALGALLSASRLQVSEDLDQLIPRTLPPAQTDRAIADHFERSGGKLVVLLQGATLEAVLEANDRLAAELRQLQQQGELSSYLSLAKLLPSQRTQRQRRERLRALDPAAIARRLEQALADQGLRPEAFAAGIAALRQPRALGYADLPAELSPLVARNLRLQQGSALLATILYPAPDVEHEALAQRLQRQWGAGVETAIGGSALAGQHMARLLERDLLVICLATLGVVLVLVTALFRRLWPVVAAVLCLALTGLLFAGALPLFGLSIDLYNLMVIPILIGYGVDDVFYIVHRSAPGAVVTGLAAAGRPVLATTLSTMAAFTALTFCQLPGLRSLGLTGLLGLGLAALVALVVLPALLTLAAPRHG